MKPRMILNAFDMSCVTHHASGTWRHPSNQAWNYNQLNYWTNLAKELERGYFDSLFIADVLGPYDVYRGSAEASLKDAAQIPVNEPFAAIPAMAAVTNNIGFGVTAAVGFEHPYILARRLSTLDHLTNGRVAWNIVSSYLNSAALNVGMDRQMEHDERYNLADEYMDVTYKLWEGSWEDGAVLRDKERGIFTDARKVHPINHEGKYYKVPGFHLCEPSPQRTPYLFQAGASGRGRLFAAKHAEAIFVLPNDPESARPLTDDMRNLVEQQGRPRDSIKICTMLMIVTGATDEAAQRKYEEYLSYADPEGILALFGGWTGLDFSQINPDEPLKAIDNDSLRTILVALTGGDGGKPISVRDVLRKRCIGGAGPAFVGGYKRVADELERWVDVGGVDGFNLSYALTPDTFTDFIDYVVPELQKRGRVQTSYSPGTIREKMSGSRDAMVAKTHPAANLRGAYVGKESVADKTKPSLFANAKAPVAAK